MIKPFPAKNLFYPDHAGFPAAGLRSAQALFRAKLFACKNQTAEPQGSFSAFNAVFNPVFSISCIFKRSTPTKALMQDRRRLHIVAAMTKILQTGSF